MFHVFVFHVCSARKKRGTCYWAAFSSVWSFYPENQITFLNPKILVYVGSEMSKIKVQEIVRNLLDKFRKLYMNGTERSSRNL